MKFAFKEHVTRKFALQFFTLCSPLCFTVISRYSFWKLNVVCVCVCLFCSYWNKNFCTETTNIKLSWMHSYNSRRKCIRYKVHKTFMPILYRKMITNCLQALKLLIDIRWADCTMFELYVHQFVLLNVPNAIHNCTIFCYTFFFRPSASNCCLLKEYKYSCSVQFSSVGVYLDCLDFVPESSILIHTPSPALYEIKFSFFSFHLLFVSKKSKYFLFLSVALRTNLGGKKLNIVIIGQKPMEMTKKWKLSIF